MKRKIFVRGPVLSQSGYGEQSRFALRALKSREDLYDIFIQPMRWGQTGWIWERNEFREWMDDRIALTQVLIEKNQFNPDLSIQITIPNEFQKLCNHNIGYTAGIETTKVAPEWIKSGNDMDKIIVVSDHAKQVFQNTMVQATNEHGETFPYKLLTEIDVVNESTPIAEPESIPNMSLDYDFNFLMVSQISPRKNMENAVKWWIEEFIDQEVGLVLKTSMVSNSIIDMEFLEAMVRSMVSKYPQRKCKVYVLHGDLSAGQMTWLYRHEKIKAMVNIAHGEGYGLPMFEAAREALPIVAVGWSGHLDFLSHNGKNMFCEVDYTIQPVQREAVWKGVIQKDSMWAFADQGSYKMKLREMRRSWPSYKEVANELQALLEENFKDEKLYEDFCNSVESVFEAKEVPKMVVL